MRLIDIVNGKWAITPDMLTEIRSIYAKHARGEKLDKAAIEALATQNNVRKSDQAYEVVNGAAVIPVEGVLAKKMNLFMAISGGASTQLIQRDISKALVDPLVSRVVLLIDSPGGTVDGTFELADFIYANREKNGGAKKIIAYSDGSMYSAAYAIGSAADEVYISSAAAGVGSIGVVAAHEDWSKSEERYGVKTTEIYAGKYKRAASQYEPLSDEGKKGIQDEVDYLFSVFVDTVARNRGVNSATVLAEMSTAVQSIFIGDQAVLAGLVDGVSTMDEVLGGTASHQTTGLGKGPAAVQTAAGAPSAETPAAQEEIVDIKELKEKHADLYQAVLAEGKTAGFEEGKAAEVARIKSVKAVAMPGHEALIEGLMFDGKTTGPEAAMAVVSAEKDKREKHLADFKSDGKDLAVPVTDGTAADAAAAAAKTMAADNKYLPAAERAKAAWDADGKLRGEFNGNYAAYLAYFEATDNGQVKMLKK